MIKGNTHLSTRLNFRAFYLLSRELLTAFSTSLLVIRLDKDFFNESSCCLRSSSSISLRSFLSSLRNFFEASLPPISPKNMAALSLQYTLSVPEKSSSPGLHASHQLSGRLLLSRL